MTQQDEYFAKLANERADLLLHEDSYYQSLATPLKSAQAIKAEERAQLCEFLQFKETRDLLDNAERLIRAQLGELIPKEEFEAAIAQFDHIPDSCVKNLEEIAQHPSEKPVFLQTIFGFSDATLVHCYTLARELATKKSYADAIAILVFLEMMAPYVSSYWQAHGLCLYSIGNYADALVVFHVAKAIDAEDPAPVYWLVQSYLALNEKPLAQQELQELKALIPQLDKEAQARWQGKLTKLRAF